MTSADSRGVCSSVGEAKHTVQTKSRFQDFENSSELEICKILLWKPSRPSGVDLGCGSPGRRKRTPRRHSPGLQETELKSISEQLLHRSEDRKSVSWCHRERTTVISKAHDHLRQGRPHCEICAYMLGTSWVCREPGGSGVGLSGLFLMCQIL